MVLRGFLNFKRGPFLVVNRLTQLNYDPKLTEGMEEGKKTL